MSKNNVPEKVEEKIEYESVNEYISKKVTECNRLIEYIVTLGSLEHESNNYESALDYESIIKCLDKDNGVGSDEGVFDSKHSYIKCSQENLIEILNIKIKKLKEACPAVFPEINVDFINEYEKKSAELSRMYNFGTNIISYMYDNNALDTFGKKLFYSNIPTDIAARIVIEYIYCGENVHDLDDPDKRFTDKSIRNIASEIRKYLDENGDVKDRLFDASCIIDIEELKKYKIAIFDEPRYIEELLYLNDDKYDDNISKFISIIVLGDKFKELSPEEKSEIYGFLVNNFNFNGKHNESLVEFASFPDVDFSYLINLLENYIEKDMSDPIVFEHMINILLKRCQSTSELKTVLETVSSAIANTKESSDKKYVLTFTESMLRHALEDKSRQ